MAEQPAVNRFVVGSSPILSAKMWPVGEAVNSYPFQGYIHAFEPRTGHHLKITDPRILGSVFHFDIFGFPCCSLCGLEG